MEDLTAVELDSLERHYSVISRDQVAAPVVLRLIAEVRRRRAAEPKPGGKKHELTLSEQVGTEEK